MKRAMRQGGQALIEFAIVMLVVLVVIAGGIELGSASLNSYALRQAADAGAQSWAGRYCTRGGAVYLTQRDGNCPDDPAFRICALPRDDDPYYLVSENPDCSAPTVARTFDSTAVLDPKLVPGVVRPSCMPAVPGGECLDPDDGLPDLDPSAPTWYPYTHRAIDITGCVNPATGAINFARCVNRIFEGYAGAPGLPPLNRALYSLYEPRCYDVAEQEVRCRGSDDGGTVDRWLLRLPGRFNPSDDGLTLANVCFDQGCATPIANTHQLNDADPVWQVFEMIDASRVQFRIRYRHQFYALLGTGYFNDGSDVPLAPAVTDQLDLGVGGLGGLGAEVTVAGDGPSYFRVPWRTFAACAFVSNPDRSGSERAASCG